jgi:hypothetical protein
MKSLNVIAIVVSVVALGMSVVALLVTPHRDGGNDRRMSQDARMSPPSSQLRVPGVKAETANIFERQDSMGVVIASMSATGVYWESPEYAKFINEYNEKARQELCEQLGGENGKMR